MSDLDIEQLWCHEPLNLILKLNRRLDALEAAAKLPQLAKIAATNLDESKKIEMATRLLFPATKKPVDGMSIMELTRQNESLRAQNAAFRGQLERLMDSVSYEDWSILQTVLESNSEIQ